MPELIRLLLRHALIGFALALLLVLCLLHFNIGHLADMMTGPDGPVALFMLIAFIGITFASAQMGIGVMLAGREDEDDHPGSWLKAVVTAIHAALRKTQSPHDDHFKV